MERELENAMGREGKLEAPNPGNHIKSKVKFKILLALLWEQCSRCSSVLRYIDDRVSNKLV